MVTSDDQLASTLDHILRDPLPWRTAPPLTECGRPGADVRSAITRADALTKAHRLGAQRMAYTTCMTCLSRADVSIRTRESWQDSPGAVVLRECERSRWDKNPLIDRELTALAMLVEAHRDEFEDALAGLESTVSLAEFRKKAPRG